MCKFEMPIKFTEPRKGERKGKHILHWEDSQSTVKSRLQKGNGKS